MLYTAVGPKPACTPELNKRTIDLHNANLLVNTTGNLLSTSKGKLFNTLGLIIQKVRLFPDSFCNLHSCTDISDRINTQLYPPECKS